MNQLSSSEQKEHEPRTTTGVIRLASGLLSDKCVAERRAIRFGEEPVFAVHRFDTHREGVKEELLAMLNDDELEMFDPTRTYIVSEGPWPNLTDSLLPGEVHRIPLEMYTEAYLKRFPVTTILL